MMPRRCEVAAENLYAHFDPLAFPVVTTAELANLNYVICQQRVARARDCGVQI
jgi:hypothetical protein